MPEEGPKARQTVTRFGILLGLLAVLVGLAIFVITDSPIFWKSPGISLPIVLGLICVLACLLLNARWLADVLLRRRTLVGVNVAFMVLFAAGVMAVLNLINLRYYKRCDLTEIGRYSLSRRTLGVLDGLKKSDKRMKITVLLAGRIRPADRRHSRNPRFRSQIRELLEEYKGHSPRVQVAFINAYADPERAERFKRNLKIKPDENDSVVVQCGDRTELINWEDMHLPQPRTSLNEPPAPARFNGEAPITRAIMTVTDRKQTVVYFLSAPKDSAVSGIAAFRNAGLSSLAARLTRASFKVESLPRKKAIPRDCDVLIIPAAGDPFDREELRVLRTYLAERSAGLIVMLEPRKEGTGAGGLATLLEEHGVKVHQDLVVIGARTGNPEIVFGIPTPGHPIGKALRNLKPRFRSAIPLEVTSAGPCRAVHIVTVSRPWWCKRSRGSTADGPVPDRSRPLTLAAAVQAPAQSRERRGARLVVFGDADFVTNRMIETSRGNKMLITSALYWAAGQEGKTAIEPRPRDDRAITATSRQYRTVFAIVMLAMPLACIILGGLVWSLRNR